MKQIIWKGPDRNTKYGLMAEGKVAILPDKAADSFIEQGLAKDNTVKKTTSKEETE